MNKILFLFILLFSAISQSVYSGTYQPEDSNTRRIMDTVRQQEIERQMQRSADEVADAVRESRQQQVYPPRPVQSFIDYNQSRK